MAIRQIRYEGDPILRKVSREVLEINERIEVLLEDMVDTMHQNEGVGLAAPQVGVLRRVVVIDIGEGLIKLINPEIIEEKGEDIGVEACLSVPNRMGTVKRPEKVVVRNLDELGEEQEIIGTGLLAKALCHEIDHLDGILYIDKMIEEIVPQEDVED